MISDESYFWLKLIPLVVWIILVLISGGGFHQQLILAYLMMVLFEVIVLYPFFRLQQKKQRGKQR